MKTFIENYSFNKNILHIINSLHFGGAESTLTYYLIEAKRSFGKKMDVAVYRNETVYCKLLDQNGISVKNLGIERKYSIRAIWETIKLIKTGKYQLVFAQLFPTSLYVALSSFFFPHITYILRETNERTRRRKYPILKIVDKFIYSRYDIIICVDKIVEDALIKWVNNVKGKTIVITKGIPLPRLSKNLEKKYDIIFVGRLVPQKNVGMLLTAVSKLKNCDTIKRVAIVGDGPLMPWLRHMALTSKIASIVDFLGERNDVTRLLQMSKIFVLPSLWEGTPSALLEAMAVGLPIIATKVGGIPEIVKHASDGILVSPNDADLLARAIKQLISDSRLAKNLGYNARTKIEQHYSITVYTKKLLTILATSGSKCENVR